MKKLIFILSLLLFVSCNPKMYALRPTGHVQKVELNRMFITFPQAIGNKPPSGAWFYYPGAKVTSKYNVYLVIEEK